MRVVLLHGLANSKRAFDRLVPLLDDFDVTAMDLPGHGAKARQRGAMTIPAMAAAAGYSSRSLRAMYRGG